MVSQSGSQGSQLKREVIYNRLFYPPLHTLNNNFQLFYANSRINLSQPISVIKPSLQIVIIEFEWMNEWTYMYGWIRWIYFLFIYLYDFQIKRKVIKNYWQLRYY